MFGMEKLYLIVHQKAGRGSAVKQNFAASALESGNEAENHSEIGRLHATLEWTVTKNIWKKFHSLITVVPHRYNHSV